MSSVLPEPLPSDAVVVFPPVSINVATRGPYLAAPLLTTYLQRNGVAAESLDLNIRFFRHLASREVFDDLIERGRTALAVLDAKAQLSPAERRLQQGLKNLFHSTYLQDERPLLEQLTHEDHFGLFLNQGRALFRRFLDRLPITFDSIVQLASTDSRNLVQDFLMACRIPRVFRNVKVVAISIPFPSQLYPALTLAKLLKESFGDSITTVFGGPQITLLQAQQRAALARLPFVDLLCRYDGEPPLLRLCQDVVSTGRPRLAETPNSVFEDQGKIIETDIVEPVSMADLPTPVYNDEELRMYPQPIRLSVYVSKGCYWGRCSFCDYAKLVGPGGTKVKVPRLYRPPELVVQDIQDVITRYSVKPKPVYLVAPAILPKYYRDLAQTFCDLDLSVELMSFMRVERTCDEDFFHLLRRAGVQTLMFGVENASDRILGLMNKGSTSKDASRVMKAAARAGISVRFALIGDYPSITEEEVQHNIEFIEAHKEWISALDVATFDLSCNSPIMDDPDSHGIRILHEREVRRPRGVHLVAFTRTQGLDDAGAKKARARFGELSRRISDRRLVQHHVDELESPEFSWNDRGIRLHDDVVVVGNNGPHAEHQTSISLYRLSLRRNLFDHQIGVLAPLVRVARRSPLVSPNDVVAEMSRDGGSSVGKGDASAGVLDVFSRLVRRGFVDAITA